MDLKELEYVVTIAKAGSISRAAEQLYMAQSSLSQFLAQYEAELGTKLFKRTSGGVRPTYAGELFIRSAQQMLQQYHRIKAELRETEHPKAGRIEFGISTYRGSHLLPPVLRRFSAEYPEVEVVIHEYDSVMLHKKIASGELDMALVALQSHPERPPEHAVMQDEVFLAATRSHPVMQYVHPAESDGDRPWVSLSDAAQFTFLLSERSTVLGSIAQQLFQAERIEPHCVNGSLSASFAVELARNGLGLAFTYHSCASSEDGLVYLSIGKARCFVDLVLIYPPDGYLSRSNRALETMIRQSMNCPEQPLH